MALPSQAKNSISSCNKILSNLALMNKLGNIEKLSEKSFALKMILWETYI